MRPLRLVSQPKPAIQFIAPIGGAFRVASTPSHTRRSKPSERPAAPSRTARFAVRRSTRRFSRAACAPWRRFGRRSGGSCMAPGARTCTRCTLRRGTLIRWTLSPMRTGTTLSLKAGYCGTNAAASTTVPGTTCRWMNRATSDASEIGQRNVCFAFLAMIQRPFTCIKRHREDSP